MNRLYLAGWEMMKRLWKLTKILSNKEKVNLKNKNICSIIKLVEYLGNKVVCHSVPIRPGRNLAVICETAAVNHRQKKMGYNAAQELYRRVQANWMKKED